MDYIRPFLESDVFKKCFFKYSLKNVLNHLKQYFSKYGVEKKLL